jgi:ribosome-associated heat shock protein Hsp15
MRDPAHTVKTGDVLTIALDNQVRLLRVDGFAERRGGAPEARLLFSEIGPSQDE